MTLSDLLQGCSNKSDTVMIYYYHFIFAETKGNSVLDMRSKSAQCKTDQSP
jgi:hypothetical protein